MVPAPFIVVLDANVLFPFTLRDTLLRAAAGFYQVRWTEQILDEATRNLVSTGTLNHTAVRPPQSRVRCCAPGARDALTVRARPREDRENRGLLHRHA